MSARPVVLSSLVALAAGGCSAPDIATGASGGQQTVRTFVMPDASAASADASAPAAAASEGGSASSFSASPYHGNPLCSATPSPGDCQPDDSVDAQSCQPVDDGGSGDADVATFACHVVSSGGAPNQPTCLPSGTGVEGQECLWPMDCAPGLECVGAGGTCRQYCCGGNDQCADAQFCDIQPVTAFNWTKVPVCVPKQPCTLLDWLSCGLTGFTCAVVKDDGSTSCVAIGPAKVGDPCNSDHCGPGLVCLGATADRRCYQLCHTKSPTECEHTRTTCKGGLPLFPDPDIGICQ